MPGFGHLGFALAPRAVNISSERCTVMILCLFVFLWFWYRMELNAVVNRVDLWRAVHPNATNEEVIKVFKYEATYLPFFFRWFLKADSYLAANQ